MTFGEILKLIITLTLKSVIKTWLRWLSFSVSTSLAWGVTLGTGRAYFWVCLSRWPRHSLVNYFWCVDTPSSLALLLSSFQCTWTKQLCFTTPFSYDISPCEPGDRGLVLLKPYTKIQHSSVLWLSGIVFIKDK